MSDENNLGGDNPNKESPSDSSSSAVIGIAAPTDRPSVEVTNSAPTQNSVVDDPLAPDAPIHHLLSIRSNPMVKDMTTEELTKLVQRLRTHATSPQSLSAKLKSDSDNVTTRRPRNAAATKRKALLDTL